MATKIIMPALEMAQETGKVLHWLKSAGDPVTAGEPVMEIETDKVTVEIQAPASGVLGGVSAREGESVPVGQTIAWILSPGEAVPNEHGPLQSGRARGAPVTAQKARPAQQVHSHRSVTASPVAAQIAREYGLDLSEIKPNGGRVEKADVLTYIAHHQPASAVHADGSRRPLASPKARRLASERGIDLLGLTGSGPGGAVLAQDVPAISDVLAADAANTVLPKATAPSPAPGHLPTPADTEMSTIWRVMVERMSASWATVPHFYLIRDVSADALGDMRKRIAPAVEKRAGVKPTYSDLLVKLVAATLRDHPRVNAAWADGKIQLSPEIHIGLATAVEVGLIVPVIHYADRLTIGEIAFQRQDLVARANAGKLRPADVSGGTFTLTNLGMYNVDAFNAIVNAPQAAILAVGRIADRVVAVDGQPAVRPMLTMTLSCDHRVVDGARAARFLDDLARLVEEPWGVLA